MPLDYLGHWHATELGHVGQVRTVVADRDHERGRDIDVAWLDGHRGELAAEVSCQRYPRIRADQDGTRSGHHVPHARQPGISDGRR